MSERDERRGANKHTDDMLDTIERLEAENEALRHDIDRHIANHAADLSPTQGADAPLGWVWERCYSNGGYTRRFCALESEARELATDGEALSHPDRVYPFFGRAQGADARPVALSRSIETWRKCDPKAMSTMSEAAIFFALKDCIHDVLALATRDATEQAARATAEQSRSDAWISVKEQLPDFDIPVAVAWDKAPWRTDGESAIDDMLHARNNDLDGWLWYTVSTGDLDEWDTEDMPTHWMPLPAAPDAAIESQPSGDGS